MGTEWKLEPAHDHGLPPGRAAASIEREPGLVAAGFHLFWCLIARAYLKAGHRLKVENRHRLPRRAPFVIVANHTSHLDALVIASALPWRITDRVFPVAAGDVFFHTKATSIFSATLINALPMWRKSCGPHALHALRQRLVSEPCGLILFPEGTRSRDGTLLAFKPGIGMLIAGTEVPVVPCRLRGCYEALPPHARMPRLRRIDLTIGEPLVFAGIPDDRDGWKRIAAALEGAVKELGR
jgi:1-acyl-sn-glycerol-3-phosphate acyltransferase